VLTSKGSFLYNGRFTEDADVTTYGMGPQGVGHVAKKGFVGHRVLLNAVTLRGGDTWATEAVGPGFTGEKEQPFQCHMQVMTRKGIWNLENMQFSQLLADNVTGFLFVWSPLKIKGGTGSPGNPVAIY